MTDYDALCERLESLREYFTGLSYSEAAQASGVLDEAIRSLRAKLVVSEETVELGARRIALERNLDRYEIRDEDGWRDHIDDARACLQAALGDKSS